MFVSLGKQTPRFELIPKYKSNAWEEAIELAKAYGLILDPWQMFALKAMLGERADGSWASSRNGLSVPRQNGKNSILEARELFGIVILGERIMHTAHEVKTSLDHFRRMREYFESNEDLMRLVKRISQTNGSEAIFLHNGGSIRFIARSKSSGRGFSGDVLVCDEAQDLDDDKFSALLPIISTAPNPQVILTGTPPGRTVNGEVFERMRNEAQEGTNERLCWLEWSADRDADIDAPLSWAQANPALGYRLSNEKIADERAAMDDETFARERLGMWSGVASTTVIDMELWDTLKTDLDPSDPVAFAVDVSPNRDMASIGVAGYIGDAVYLFVIERRKGTGWIANRLKELKDKWEPVAICIDQNGPAASLIPELQALRIRVMQTNGSDMANACGIFFDRVQNEKLMHADQPDLNAALAAATKRPIRDAWGWQRKNANADITPLVSTTLAMHGLLTKRKPKGEREATTQRVRLLN